MKEDQQESRFLAVVGPSGSGKSSVVKAGLLPALRQGALPGSAEWFVVQMTPGARPLDELEIGLLRIATAAPANLAEQLRRDEHGLVRAARLALPDDEARCCWSSTSLRSCSPALMPQSGTISSTS